MISDYLWGKAMNKISFGRAIIASLVSVFSLAQIADVAIAAEKGIGTYLLGQSGPQAGMLPPVSGVFSTNTVYIYSGGANPSTVFENGGQLIADVDVDLVLGVPGVLWVPDAEILGGRLGIFGVLPLGSVGVDADVTASLPGSPPLPIGSVSQSRVSVGDPQVGGLIGWTSGPFHWNIGTLINVPIGDYQDGALDNLSFNHWSVAFYSGLTWLDPATGFELSGRAGITINDKNSATDYKTGEEFHLEFAALKHFSPQFNAGLAGYSYHQI
ncbi:MAG: SphA family protein, partial [Anderseniella sp.]